MRLMHHQAKSPWISDQSDMRKLPDLDSIHAFLAVAEALSFRRAAERLGLDQSALSRRIKELEQRVGTRLLVRTTHAVGLTEAGRAFYGANRDLLDGIVRSVERARRIGSGKTGLLRIAYMTFAAVELVPAAMRKFREKHPDVDITLTYERTQAQKLSLARGQVDIGVMLGPFEHADFGTSSLGWEDLAVLLPIGHELAHCRSLPVSALDGIELVLGTDQQWDFYREVILDVLSTHGVEARIEFEAPSLTGIIGLVRAGLGATLVPRSVAGMGLSGVVAVPLADAGRGIETIAVWRRPADGKVEAFVEALNDVTDRVGPRSQASTVSQLVRK